MFSVVRETCEDVPGWTDSQGYDCEVYATSNQWCEKYGDDFENDGRTANEACCVCGGDHFNWTSTAESEDTSSTNLCCDRPRGKRCPADRPVMCNARGCEGYHCCARTVERCSERGLGGPRVCGFVSALWAIGDRVATSEEPERCGTLINVAAGSMRLKPYRIQYDNGTSPWLSESDLERSAACSGEDGEEDRDAEQDDNDDDANADNGDGDDGNFAQ